MLRKKVKRMVYSVAEEEVVEDDEMARGGVEGGGVRA